MKKKPKEETLSFSLIKKIEKKKKTDYLINVIKKNLGSRDVVVVVFFCKDTQKNILSVVLFYIFFKLISLSVNGFCF